MQLTFNVRDLNIADATAAADLHAQTWQDAYTGLLPTGELAARTPEKLLPMWRTLLAENPAKLYHIGAFREQTLLGICSAGRPRDSWGYDAEMWAMNVPMRNQKQGIGKALFNAVMGRFRTAGYKNFYLYCLEQNTNALAFYQHLGGVLTEREKFSFGAREIAVAWDSIPSE